MNNIPYEMYDHILSHLKINVVLNITNLSKFYRLRIINKSFKKYIDNVNDLIYFEVSDINNIFNRLCRIGLLKNFIWLFNNNLYLSINNINNLIIYYRSDVIQLLLKYNNLKDILFNRFNLFSVNENLDIISLTKSNNPLITCAKTFNNKKTNLDIIKLLLDDTIKNNPYIHQLSSLFITSIKYNNIILIKYLVTFYYDNIMHLSYRLINYMMCSNNNEDLFFYLVQNDKININDKFLANCIKKKYNDLFIFSYDKIDYNSYKYIFFLTYIYQNNNLELFEYILKNIPNINFEYIINNMILYDDMFFYISLLLNEYFNKIPKKSLFIKLCIKNNIEKTIIKHLIDNNYKLTSEDINYCIRENI